MKVVINRCFGGFGLSDKAVEACVALGMTVRREDEDGWADFVCGGKFGTWCEREHDKAFRCDPRVVRTVEALGDEANGSFALLRVVEIPFDTTDGWDIHDHAGMETIEEDHRIWR